MDNLRIFFVFLAFSFLLVPPSPAENHAGGDREPKHLIAAVKDSIKAAHAAIDDLETKLAQQKKDTAAALQQCEQEQATKTGVAKELQAEKAKRADVEAKLRQFALQLDELARQRQLLDRQVAAEKKAREILADELKGQDEKLALMQEMLREEVSEKIKATDELDRLKMEKQKMDIKIGVLLDSEQKSRELQRSLDLIRAENSYVLAELARINELLKPFQKNNH